MHGTREASKLRKGESAYNPWTHISHKELTYLLQKSISPRSKVLLACPWGGGWEELTIARPRYEQHKDSINDKSCSHLSANVSGHHFTCVRIYLRKDLLPLTPLLILNFNSFTSMPQYYHLNIAKLLQGIKHIIFSDLQVLCRIL